MSLKDSFLSKKISDKKQYNADMVTVVTEKSLNSQMRAYLSRCNWRMKVYFLKTTDDYGKIMLFEIDKDVDDSKIPEIFELGEKTRELKNKGSSVFKELEKLNLFSLTTGTKSTENSRVFSAMEYSLGFALDLEDGLPAEIVSYLAKNKGLVDPDEFLKIIAINPTNSSVIFKQFFKRFEVLQLNIQINKTKIVGILSVEKQKCDAINPLVGLWSTKNLITLNLRSTEYIDILDDKVKDKICSMAEVKNPDTVFDISQLLLDLSTLQTIYPIAIEGLSLEVKGIISNCVNEYFSRLEKAGQTIFGHIVLPKPNMSVNYLFTPCVKNFATTQKGIYYLINFVDARTPVIPNLGNNADFEWKPLLEDSDVADGAMVINATKFIPFIRDKFESILQYFALDIHPYAEAKVYKLIITYKTSQDTIPQKLVVDENKPWESSWNYAKSYEQDWQICWAPPLPIPVGSAKADSNYTVSCKTGFGSFVLKGITYPSYDFIFDVLADVNLGYNSEDNKGTYFNQTLKCQIGLKLDANGYFNFISNIVKTEIPFTKIETSIWGEFWSAGGLQDTVDALTKYLDGSISKAIGSLEKAFSSKINSFVGWFLPGCRTFTYKNENISKFGDFYAYVNYVQE